MFLSGEIIFHNPNPSDHLKISEILEGRGARKVETIDEIYSDAVEPVAVPPDSLSRRILFVAPLSEATGNRFVLSCSRFHAWCLRWSVIGSYITTPPPPSSPATELLLRKTS